MVSWRRRNSQLAMALVYVGRLRRKPLDHLFLVSSTAHDRGQGHSVAGLAVVAELANRDRGGVDLEVAVGNKVSIAKLSEDLEGNALDDDCDTDYDPAQVASHALAS